MRTLDRYIIRSFVSSLVLWFAVLMSLRIVIDLFVNMDEFAKLGKPFGEILGDITTYYGYQSVVYVVELGGVIIVAAAAFTMARMNHTNELTAMLASGVSMHRVVWPIVLCAMLMGGLLILDQELVVPGVADKLARGRDDAPGAKEFQVRLTTDGSGTSWYSPRFFPLDKVMERPTIVIRDIKGVRLAQIEGSRATYHQYEGVPGWMVWDARLVPEGRREWLHTPDTKTVYTAVGPQTLLESAKEQARLNKQEVPDDSKVTTIRGVAVPDPRYGIKIEAESLELAPFVPGKPRQGTLRSPKFTYRSEDGKLLGIILADFATWVGGSLDTSHWDLSRGVLFYPSDLAPEHLKLRQSSRWLDTMSVSQITEYLRLERVPDRDAAELTRHVRVADPVNNLIMLLLGLPFILSRERNIKASAGLCLLMVGAYYAFIYICRYMSLPPAWAAWLPVLLFGPVAAVMFDSIKT